MKKYLVQISYKTFETYIVEAESEGEASELVMSGKITTPSTDSAVGEIFLDKVSEI